VIGISDPVFACSPPPHQGPKAAQVVQKHLPAGVDLAQQNFMTTQNATLAGAPDCILSRCV
jgi:glycine cleavage system aminomethyltransferase T